VEGARFESSPAAPDTSSTSVTADTGRTLDEQLEVERDRRRRMVAALLYGREARPATVPPGAWAPLFAGIAVALFVVLLVAVGTLIHTAFPAARAPAAHPSPTISSR
jgi:hypothetical protein